MSLSARVVDAATGQPLPGATISLDGKAVAVADSLGNFSYDGAGINVTASYVGYSDNTLPEGVVADDGQIQLNRADQSLPVASVTAKIKENPLPVLLAVGGGWLLLTAKKKKAMRGIGKIDTTTILLIAAGAAAVYLLTRPRTTTLPATSYVPGYNPYQIQPPPVNTTAQDITAAGGAASSILNAISNL
jgi:hypothetical protein